MKSLKQYSVPHTGLKLGKHQFSFDVDKAFFDEFEYSLVKEGKVKVDLVLDKQETMLILDFKLQGQVYLTCDRCLSEYPQHIEGEDRLIAKFSEDKELEDDSEEVVVLTKNDSEINVSEFIYEMITLSLPYINLCDAPGNTSACDEEMIAKLKELSAEEEENNNTDPRWDALKSIKNN
ncbi:protein of unknown function DUF177 [Pseudopedobacter saltans DSM 12145]|uniref:DUF177 domain-containing protein n=1 Tax=Pseudopedobacter saltans (strain ATCC 51119 / DSM 12145 / JCM 21818 / CCUG 39354 / LMG 10337 / NBRC 100064 / NCIMB 13643) TaxID=762903 RepID=F0SBZ8_PSESL|nr:YceD family protein [Pseudopedobacter saltans]ADY53839.1 protein of unknown function DUF177 [Pseudopedobacter saltans DSM 12145]